MVRRIHGLKKARGAPAEFGGELGSYAGSAAPGDEVRCIGEGQTIYLMIREVSAEGSLVGEVVSFGEPVGVPPNGVRVGDLVEIAADCVLAVLPRAGEPAVGGSALDTLRAWNPIAALKQ